MTKIDKLPIDRDTYRIMERIYKKTSEIPYILSSPYDEYNFLKTLEKLKRDKK